MNYLKEFNNAVNSNKIDKYFQDFDNKINNTDNIQYKSELMAYKALSMMQVCPFKLEEIKTLADEALKMDLNNNTALMVIALYYLEKKDYNQSLDLFSLLESKESNVYLYKYYKAKIFIELKKFDEAWKEIQWLNTNHVNKVSLDQLNGSYFASIGNLEDAFKHYDKALKYKEFVSKESLAFMTNYYYKGRKYSEALNYLEKLMMITYDTREKDNLLNIKRKINLKLEIIKSNKLYGC
jgi:tetratricopeptide (TPR) repeat protein